MKLSKFKFNLPEELIALHPAKNRDESRLMVVNRKTGEVEHREHFKEILDYFNEKDVFIFNNTKVFPARLYGNKEKTGARIEVFLLRELNPELRLWDVLVDPARKIRIGNKLYFGEDDSMVAEVIDNTTSRGRTLRFLYDGDHGEFKKALYALGETPLPKYIEREIDADDEERYQNIFASEEGAVVAPAAGLHFSRELLKRLEIKDCRFAFLTLHSGLGNFRDIDVEDLTKHKMDSEEMLINAEVVRTVNEGKDTGKQIDQQAGIDKSGARYRYVHEHINRFVKRRIRIEVISAFQPVFFEVVLHFLSGEMRASVKSHVFKQVGQSPLVFFLLQRAGVLYKVKLGSLFRLGVPPYIICQPVLQFSVQELRFKG